MRAQDASTSPAIAGTQMHVTETVALVAGHAIIVPVVDADDGPVVALQDTDRRGPRLADVRAPAVPGLQDVRPQDGEG